MARGDTFILPDQVRALAIDKTYAINNILHHQDDIFQHICFIQSGRAFALSVDIEGEETWIAEFGPGQFIGCASLFDAQPSSYQVVAKTPVRGLLFTRHNFLSIMNEYSALNNIVIADLVRQIEDLTRHKIDMHRLSMRGQIISELLRMARPVGKDPDTHIIRPTPIFSELAQRLGSTRETVSRTVSGLVKKELFERRTGALVVPDIEALEVEVR